MAVTFSEENKEEEQQQLAYLGLKPRVMKTATVRLPGTESPAEDAPKKKSSALPLVVGAAAIVFLLANK